MNTKTIWDDIKRSDDFLFAKVMQNERICKKTFEDYTECEDIASGVF